MMKHIAEQGTKALYSLPSKARTLQLAYKDNTTYTQL